MDKFIYVFSAADRDMLLGGGFLMLREDRDNGVYVFLADSSMAFMLNDISYLTSDTLTF